MQVSLYIFLNPYKSFKIQINQINEISIISVIRLQDNLQPPEAVHRLFPQQS